MTKFYWKLDKAARNILEAVSLALSLSEAEKSHLFKLHSGHNNQHRLLHYPPISTETLRKQVIARMAAHCDWRYACENGNAFSFLTPLTLKIVHLQYFSKTTVEDWSLKIRTIQAHSYQLRQFPAPWPSILGTCSKGSAMVRFFYRSEKIS